MLTWSSLHAWLSREPADLTGLEPEGLPWTAFGRCSHSPASPLDYRENKPTDLSGLNAGSLPWLACIFPLEFPLRVICRMVSEYIYIYMYTVYFPLSIKCCEGLLTMIDGKGIYGTNVPGWGRGGQDTKCLALLDPSLRYWFHIFPAMVRGGNWPSKTLC
jgi:hypothetical protein